jgi:hypothetical protein
MSKFNRLYNTVVEGMRVVGVNPDGSEVQNNTAAPLNTQQTLQPSTDNLTPEQRAAVSKALVSILNSNIPKNVATPGFNNSSANMGAMAGSTVEKVKAAGTRALDTIGNMTVKDVLGVAKNVITAPMQAQQAAVRNIAQAGFKTGQDIANILMNIAKQKGASEQDINQILNQIKQERDDKWLQRTNQYMGG